MVEACGPATGLPVHQLNHDGELSRREESGTRVRPQKARAMSWKDCKPSDLVMLKKDV